MSMRWTFRAIGMSHCRREAGSSLTSLATAAAQTCQGAAHQADTRFLCRLQRCSVHRFVETAALDGDGEACLLVGRRQRRPAQSMPFGFCQCLALYHPAVVTPKLCRGKGFVRAYPGQLPIKLLAVFSFFSILAMLMPVPMVVVIIIIGRPVHGG
jgi:hypothetical protein